MVCTTLQPYRPCRNLGNPQREVRHQRVTGRPPQQGSFPRHIEPEGPLFQQPPHLLTPYMASANSPTAASTVDVIPTLSQRPPTDSGKLSAFFVGACLFITRNPRLVDISGRHRIGKPCLDERFGMHGSSSGRKATTRCVASRRAVSISRLAANHTPSKLPRNNDET